MILFESGNVAATDGTSKGMLEHDPTVDAELVVDKPSTDPIAMERARERIERAMFGDAPPPRLGRYEIRDPIASGGMGLVYAAHDPQLERPVALKVVHPSRADNDRARLRLLDEARALARLDHPNVVKVHDVLTHDDQIVIVMELVDGVTLDKWVRQQPRDWRDIVRMYLGAGRGLEAAHSVDVIHRDFKPSNVVIGRDGHAHVLDFGLARIEQVTPSTDDTSSVVDQTTSVGPIMCTPAFAAPEQLAGSPATALSDQFSFCVALHRGLEGVTPFEGDSVDDRLRSIQHAEPATAADGRRVPAWLRTLIRRGLSVSPSKRFPTMAALLHELGRERGWRRWRWPMATTLSIGGAIAATSVMLDHQVATCDGRSPVLASIWNDESKARLLDHLHLVAPLPSDAATRVVDELDRRQREWTATSRAVCEAHRDGRESDTMLDLKSRCLDRQLAGLRAAIGIETTLGSDAADNATEIALRLPHSAWCEDSNRVAEDDASPSDPAIADEIEKIRRAVSWSAVLDHAGYSQVALAIARCAAVTAELHHHLGTVIEADLEIGRILIQSGDEPSAVEPLRRALDLSLETNRPRTGVEAGARLLFVEGSVKPDLDPVERLSVLEPWSRQLRSDNFSRPLLFNNAAAVLTNARRRTEARQYALLAKASLGQGHPDPELIFIDDTLARLTDAPLDRESLAKNAWTEIRAVYGDSHPKTLTAQSMYAIYASTAERAYELLSPVCQEHRRRLDGLFLDCELVAAYLASELGRTSDARLGYESMIAATEHAIDADTVVWRHLAAAELAMLNERPTDAKASFGHVIELYGDSTNWWDRQLVYQAHSGLGRIAKQRGDIATARRHFTIAKDGYADLAAINPSIMYTRRISALEKHLE